MSSEKPEENPGKRKRPTTLVYVDPTTFTMEEINRLREPTIPDRPTPAYWAFAKDTDPE